jgi:hypothetical protein
MDKKISHPERSQQAKSKDQLPVSFQGSSAIWAFAGG